MRIWIDADACPNAIKDILFRAAERVKIATTLVANQTLRTPPSQYIRAIRVAGGFDAADDYIVQQMQAGDLVITADIPLADAVIAKQGHALNPRGDFYTTENIKQRLAMRDFMDQLRGSGIQTGGPAALNAGDQRAFANRLDSFLAKHARS